MWKVKRMNTARIVVLTIAIGTGGMAALVACGSDNRIAVPAGPAAQQHAADFPVTKSEFGLGRSVEPGDPQGQTPPTSTASNNFIDTRGESFSVVRYDGDSRQPVQKWLKGRTI
jgi:pilus assembly protein CpaB